MFINIAANIGEMRSILQVKTLNSALALLGNKPLDRNK